MRSKKKIVNYDEVILENHGIVTVDSTVDATSNLNEMIEEGAKIQFLVMMLTGRDGINLAELKEKFKT